MSIPFALKVKLIPTLLTGLILLSALSLKEASAITLWTEPEKTIVTGDSLYRKTVPDEVREAAIEALSHYPELEKVPIRFIFKERFQSSFMEAQPELISFIKNRKKRVYVIKMTRSMLFKKKNIPIEELPHKVLVGWIGHELGHIMDYRQRSSANMALFGLRYYLFDSYKAKAEREADLFAIRHGLADEIIATKKFILSNSSLPKYYIAKIERLYLSPAGVLELVKEIEEEDPDDAIEEIEEVEEES